MGLDRRRAIVTGGSCGNGCAALKRFVDEGAKMCKKRSSLRTLIV